MNYTLPPHPAFSPRPLYLGRACVGGPSSNDVTTIQPEVGGATQEGVAEISGMGVSPETSVARELEDGMRSSVGGVAPKAASKKGVVRGKNEFTSPKDRLYFVFKSASGSRGVSKGGFKLVAEALPGMENNLSSCIYFCLKSFYTS